MIIKDRFGSKKICYLQNKLQFYLNPCLPITKQEFGVRENDNE